MADPIPTMAGTIQPSGTMDPTWDTLTMRRTESSIEDPAAANNPSDRASTTSMATVVPAMAAKEKITPLAVPVNAWVRARPSRWYAARTSWAQKVATNRTRPIGRISS